MNSFPTCKISVLKTLHHQDLAAEYRRPDVHQGPCPIFKVGDEFTVNYLAERPKEFKCDWAWHDIHKIIMILMTNGNFGTWMKNKDNFITCCTDGVKPVIFKVERIEMSKPEFPSKFPRIETERFILREITRADTQAIFRNFSEPEIARWFLEEPLTEIEQVSQFIDHFISEFEQGEGITWAIEMKETHECVGTCSLGEIEIGKVGEMGFDLAKEYWGQGIMGESLIAIINYGISALKLAKFDAHTYSANTRAKHLLKKLGFQLDRVKDESEYFSLVINV